MEMLHGEVILGRVNLDTYAELSKAETNYKRRVLDFVKTSPKYDGNLEKVFDRCENYGNYGTGEFFMELLKEISNSQV
jgi:hypothetical protein